MTLIDDRRAKRNVAVLVAAQAILGAQLPMIFVVGGLAGGTLASNPCFATLPISLIMFGSMTTAPWLSPLMQRYGRRSGFVIGALGGAVGAAISAYALYSSSFLLLLVGSYFTGVYMSAHGFYRFAAADTASDTFRPKAISYVMAGGLLSAILGPQLNKFVSDVTVWPVIGELFLPVPFIGTYLAVVILNCVGVFLFAFLDIPKEPEEQVTTSAATAHGSKWALLQRPTIAAAIICAMVSYALMNLVMTATPLAVLGCGFTIDDANDIVSAHILAMFAPSFFVGHLIVKFGAKTIVSVGLLLLALAGVLALSGITLTEFYGSLILLGLGWNFGFIGATALLAEAHSSQEKGRVQGLNDAIVFGGVTLASLASGGLMNCSGGVTAADGWSAVNMAMVPFLLLAGGALVWLTLIDRRKATTSEQPT